MFKPMKALPYYNFEMDEMLEFNPEPYSTARKTGPPTFGITKAVTGCSVGAGQRGIRPRSASILIRLIAVFLSCTWLGSSIGKAEGGRPNPPQVVLAESRFDFGEAFRGEALMHSFAVRNAGGSPLDLSEATTSGSNKPNADCGCRGNGVTVDHSIEPGRTGLIRVSFDTAAESGKIERNYVIQTNDPAHPTIKITISALVRPRPDWLVRLQNGSLDGERVSGLTVWPTTRPQIRLATQEAITISLRVTQSGPDAVPDSASSTAETSKQPAVSPQAPRAVQGANGGNGGNGGIPKAPVNPVPLAAKKASYHVRRDSSDVSWIDIDIGPLARAGLFVYPLVIPPDNGKLSGLNVEVTISVIDDQVVVVPSSLDLSGIQLPEEPAKSAQIGQIGIRTSLRTLHVLKLSSSIPFIRLDAQTILDGKNYLIKLILTADANPQPGTYEGTVRISTDDKSRPTIVVPCRITLVKSP
jgi:hypothetical protein